MNTYNLMNYNKTIQQLHNERDELEQCRDVIISKLNAINVTLKHIENKQYKEVLK